MGSAEPSQSGVDMHKGTAAGGRPGPAPSRGGGVRASEGRNSCTRPSFATKNVFDVLHDPFREYRRITRTAAGCCRWAA